VAGYYTAPNGQMLSYPFNSSTTIFYYNKDAFKKAGLDANKPPATWPEVFEAASKLKASGHSCPFTTSWMGWTQLESFSPGTTRCSPARTTALAARMPAADQHPAARAPHRKPGQGRRTAALSTRAAATQPRHPSHRVSAP
jgi:hypothetical protein